MLSKLKALTIAGYNDEKNDLDYIKRDAYN